MSRLKPTRCCYICGGLFPIQSHYGLSSEVYCHQPEHWRAVGLDPQEIIDAFEAYVRRSGDLRSQLRTKMAEIRAALAAPPPTVSHPDEAEIHARFLRMLSWLDEPPKDSA